MPNSKLELRRAPEQTRSKAGVEAILKALADLLADKNLDDITITQIAKRAGLSKAAVYRYFPGKSAIVHALIRQVFSDSEHLIDATISPKKSVERVLEDGFREYLERHLREPFRVQLRSVMRADQDLSRLDLEDSHKNATLIASFLSRRGVSAPGDDLAGRILLMIELADAAIRLISTQSRDDANRTISEFCNLACHHILNEQ